ncbi:MAG: MarR family transcriptional regulator [Lachnospiraceae bacterium]|nr:MarR family transcriptional regulator [Lachnospiraceae bacterium]
MELIQSMQSLLIAHLAFKKNIENNLKRYGFNPGNPRTLLYISDHEGCRQKDLAEAFYVESCTLSSVLTNMEESGFIERRRSEKDKRSYAIYMTPKGRQISETVRKQFYDTIETALSGFSQKEAAQLHDYLDRVADNLKKANAHKQ